MQPQSPSCSPAVPEAASRTGVTMRVIEKTRISQTIMILRMKPAIGESISRMAGQYVQIVDAQGKRRPFSVANAPDPEGGIELHIRFNRTGEFSRHVFETMSADDTVIVEGPFGEMVPRARADQPILMIAGGVGLAPINALIEHYLRQPEDRRVALYWGAAGRGDLYMHERYLALTAAFPRFRYVPVLSEDDGSHGLRQGMVHEAVATDFAEYIDAQIYMSGPSEMVAASRAALLRLGGRPERMLSD